MIKVVLVNSIHSIENTYPYILFFNNKRIRKIQKKESKAIEVKTMSTANFSFNTFKIKRNFVSVIVVIIDSGVGFNHADLKEVMWK